MDAATAGDRARAARRARSSPTRRPCRSAPPAPATPDARGGLRAGRRGGLPPRVHPGAGPHRPGLRRPAQVPQARRRHRRRTPRSAGSRSTRPVLDFDERPDLPEPTASGIGSAEAAEMAKLAETTYRDVNIGLANQFARFADAHGIDVYAVIEACNSQPYSHIHQPGIAVGGHCIPVYPRLYLWNDPDATVVRAAREANAAMPEYAVSGSRRRTGTWPARGRRPRRRLPRRRQGDGVLRRLPRGGTRFGSAGPRPRPRPAVHRCGADQLRLGALPPRRTRRRRHHPGRPRRVRGRWRSTSFPAQGRCWTVGTCLNRATAGEFHIGLGPTTHRSAVSLGDAAANASLGPKPEAGQGSGDGSQVGVASASPCHYLVD